MDLDTNKLEPAFDFTSCESSVLLHQSQAEVCIDGKTYSGLGKVCLDFLPCANIHLYGEFHNVPSSDSLNAMFGNKKMTSFSINSRQVNGFLLNISGDASKTFVKWGPKSEPINVIGDESTQMTRTVFHLFNFVNLIGIRRSAEQSGSSIRRIEHIDLVYDEWKVELKSLFFTEDNIKSLKAEGGYRLTHIGCLEKLDCTSFSAKDAVDCLEALRFFLSFAKGGWCEPICPVGFDVSDKRIWESLSSPREPWHTLLSWFDPHNSSQLATLYPGFMKRWANDDWHEALHEVIYWCLNANRSSRGIDAGIILTQAAIERLSYEFSVKERKLITAKGFKDLWASDKFRLLFSSLGMPLDIPAETPDLKRLAVNSQINWLDAPHALTDIRNSLVHPEHKRRSHPNNVYYEAWNLGLWYLEMCILAICGYSGTYGNRLKQRRVGQTENVPWK